MGANTKSSSNSDLGNQNAIENGRCAVPTYGDVRVVLHDKHNWTIQRYEEGGEYRGPGKSKGRDKWTVLGHYLSARQAVQAALDKTLEVDFDAPRFLEAVQTAQDSIMAGFDRLQADITNQPLKTDRLSDGYLKQQP